MDKGKIEFEDPNFRPVKKIRGSITGPGGGRMITAAEETRVNKDLRRLESDLSTATAERDRLDEQVNRLSREISRLNGELSERDLMQYRLEQYHTVLRNLGATFDKDELVLTMPFFCDNCKTLLTEVGTTTAERDRLREALEKLINAWSDSWDCSADPGHGTMESAIIIARATLSREVRAILEGNEWSDDLIKLPVRYDKEFRYIFDADDKPLAELATHGGQHIATCINEHTALRDRITALTEALERAREALVRVRGAIRPMPIREKLATDLTDIDRALYRGEEEKG